jgi:hypothetical protein
MNVSVWGICVKYVDCYGCRVIIHVVSSRFPNTAAGIRTHIRSYVICDGRTVTGAGFLRVLWFPLRFLNTVTSPYSEECRLLECDAVYILWNEQTYRRNISPPSSGYKNPRTRNQREQVAVDSQDLHGATPQKTEFFIVTAVKTSNSPYSLIILILTLCSLVNESVVK